MISHFRVPPDTVWPVPDPADHEVEDPVGWKLTWNASLTKKERLHAASVINAYAALLTAPMHMVRKVRAEYRRHLREAAGGGE